MSKLFNNVQFYKPKKNKFDLSHERKMSMKMGTLTPFLVQEIIPGDSFRVNTEMLMRLQPLIAPMFHRVRVKTDYFFVPNRLVWDNWQNFITGGDTGTDNPTPPYYQIGDAQKTAGFVEKGSLADYMGIPTFEKTDILTNIMNISALPFRAYQTIYNEYYRDQNIIPEINVPKTDGAQADLSNMNIRWRAWEKDYFTSALPWAQKGGAVEMPTDIQYKFPSQFVDANGNKINSSVVSGKVESNLGDLSVQSPAAGPMVPATVDNIESLGTTINDLRVAVRLQEWLERNARAGSRYIESILSNFGVLSSDARLQRPEYLGGGLVPIVISEVLSTYQQSDDTGYPQGTMSGHGIATGGYGGFKRKFEEHGFVIGIMTVIPRTAYQQGIPKHYTRFDNMDYAWPSFAQLGEQAIKQSELYFDPTGANNDATFGYQSRYAEYKYQPSTVHGDFRDNLAFWHMGRIFDAPPVLNEGFITADPTKRVFAVESQDEDEILCQIYNRVDAIRPLPYFNTPTL
ncbi:MAG: major capsid protein [Microviridae sp.]|nr:MAG: major capsid protein [Microviridae sp.]